MNLLKKLICALIYVAISIVSYAQPANDDCTGVINVTPDGSCVSGTTVGAADNWNGLVGCQSGNPNGDHVDVWYSFTSTGTSLDMTITTSGAWTGDVEFTLVTGTCGGTFTEVLSQCGASPMTIQSNAITNGQTYYFTISNGRNETPGDFQVCTETTAPPATCTDNDDCSTPEVLSLTTGTQLCLNDCNTGATSGPDFTGTNCYDFPNATVWYEFTTTATNALVSVSLTSSDLANPYFTIFTSSDCSFYNIIDCAASAGGMAASNNVTIQPNTTYLIAVSDEGGDEGAFDLCVTTEDDNSACNTNDNLTVSATSMGSPLDGPYQPGEIVTFCYEINGWMTASTQCNYLQGIVPTFGDCWDPVSFDGNGMPTVTTPLTTQGVKLNNPNAGTSIGTWSWFPAGTVDYNLTGPSNLGLVQGDDVGAGWFFLTNYQGHGGDPNLSYGDHDIGGASNNSCLDATTVWTVCFQLQVKDYANSCGASATNCEVSVKTYADGEIGSWINSGCTADLQLNKPASMCCIITDLADDAICLGDSIDLVNIFDAANTAGTYTYYDAHPSSGGTVITNTVVSPTTPTMYWAQYAEGSCGHVDSFLIDVNTIDASFAYASSTFCISGGNQDTISVGTSGGTFSATGSLVVDPNSGTIDVASSGVTTGQVYYTVSAGCTDTDTLNISITSSPDATIGYAGPYCPVGTDTVTFGSGASGGVFSSTAGLVINSSTGEVDLANSTPASYTITNIIPASGACPADTGTASITINALPTVVANATQTTICAGDSSQLSGSGAVSYVWDNSVNDGDFVSPSGNTTYTVTGTDANNCVNTDQVTVNVNALPTVVANATQTTICAGDSSQLSGSGAVSYVWDNSVNDGDFVSPSGNTTYTVTGTDANNCVNTDQVTVNVNALPTVVANATQTTICAGDSSQLSGSGAVSYVWDNSVNDGDFVSPSGNTTYTVTGTDANNCVNTDQVTVNVNALPTVVANATQTTICAGDSSQLTGSGAVSYVWDNSVNDGDFVSPSGNTTYTVTGTDANNCVNTDQVTVNVNALPTVVANATQTTICAGDSSQLTGSGAVSYVWDNSVNDGDFVSPSGNTTYTVTGTDANNCVNTDQVTVNVNALPTVVANATQTTICAGDSSQLTGSGAVSYVWDNSVNDGDFVSPSGNTTYTVTGTDANNCVNTDQVTVNVNALPTVVANATQTTICAGDSSQLTGSGAVSYVWDNSVNDGDFVSPSGNTTYTVTGTDANNCVNTDQVSITVNAVDDASFGYSSSTFCLSGGVQDTVFVGTSGGVFTSTGSLIVNSTSGAIDVQNSGVTVDTVYYTTQGTCPSTSFLEINITASPILTFNYAGPYCPTGTASVTFTGGGAAATFSSTSGLVINAGNGDVDLANSTPGTYTVSNIVAAGGGCSADTAISSITINSLPTVVANATQTTICAGDSSQLTGSGAVSYVWDNSVNDGDFVSPSGNTTYTVTGTDANNCVNTDQVTVNVNALPTVVANATQTTICAGDSSQLTGSGAVSYVWDNSVNDGDFVSPSGNTTYTVTGTDANNCVNTDQVTVTVNAVDDASFGYSSSTFCLSGGVQDTVFVGTSGGVFTSTGSLIVDATTGAIDVQNSGVTVDTVYYTTQGVCPSTSFLEINITASPILTFNYAGPYCPTGTASVTFTGGGAAATFSSTSGLVIDAGNGNVDLVNSTPGTYTVSNIIAAGGGCSADTATSSITINSLPTVVANATQTTICAGDSSQLSGSGAVSYVWDNGVTDGDFVSPTTNTTYTVIGTDTNSCVNTDQITISILAADDASFSYGSNTFCISGTDPDTVSVGTSGGVFSASGSGSVDANSGTINLAASGISTFNITYTTQGACPDTTTQTITITDSLNAEFNYAGPYCQTGIATVTFGTGASAGTFSSTTGLVIDASTGDVDLAASTPGTYVVNNDISASGGCSPANYFDTLIISSSDDASFALTAFCEGEANQASNIVTSGGVFSYNPDPNDGSTVDASTGEISNGVGGTTYTIQYATTGTCPDTVTNTVTVNVSDDASFTLSNFCIGTTNSATVTGTSGGVFAFSPDPGDGATIDASTGEINNGVAGTTYSVSYITGGTCPDTSVQTVTVVSLADASFAFSGYCEGDNNQAININTAGGVFSFAGTVSDGASINDSTGEITNGVGGTTYAVEYTVGSGSCENKDTIDVYVDGVDAVFTVNPTSGQAPLTVELTNQSTLAGSYLWNFGTGATSTEVSPTYTYTEEGSYTIKLYAYSEVLGCIDSMEFSPIQVLLSCELNIPTAFTPEGDGTNDEWVIDCFDNTEGGSVVVYNRWGVKVYESVSGPSYESWDGTGPSGSDLPIGSYYFVVDYEDESYNGTVTIIR